MSRAVMLLACCTTLMGCILRDFDYEEPANVPPSVHGTNDPPMSQIRFVRLDEPAGGDAGAVGEWRFVAMVRDANVDQQLIGLVYLDRNPDAPMRDALIDDFIIPAEQDEDPLNRRVEVTVGRADLTSPGCHLLELHVTSRVTGITDPRPADPADVGVGLWYIGAWTAGTTSIGLDECPTNGPLP